MAACPLKSHRYMADIVEKRTTESVSVKNTNRWDTEGWCTDKNRVVRTNASFCPFLHSALCSKALAVRLKRPKHLTAGITSSSSADVIRNVFVLGTATHGTSNLKETRPALRLRITTKSRNNALGAVYLSAPTSSAPKHEFRTPVRLRDRRPTAMILTAFLSLRLILYFFNAHYERKHKTQTEPGDLHQYVHAALLKSPCCLYSLEYSTSGLLRNCFREDVEP